MEGTSSNRGPLSAARAVVVGITALGVVQLSSVAFAARASLAVVPQVLKEGLRSIAGHIALFQFELLFAVLAAGGALGLFAWLLGVRSRLWTTPFVWGGAALLCARTLAHKPALFEDFLWRQGGWRAQLQVFVVETVGLAAIDFCLGLLLSLGLIRIIWRWRRELLTKRGVAGLAVAGVIALGVFWPAPHRPSAKGPAVVMLVADSLRPDHLSSETPARATSPNLDALRRSGAFVEDFVVPIASTIPSWATYLTGLYPHHHGIRDIFPRAEQIDLRVPTVPSLFSANGYETAVVSDYAGDMFSRVRFGFQTVDAPPSLGLEVVAEREAVQRLPLVLGLFSDKVGERLFPVMRFLTDNADPARLTDRVNGQLDRLESTGKPFFLVAFYSVTHLPFAVPMPDAAAFTSRAYKGRSRYGYELQQLNDIDKLADRPPEEEIQQVRGLYDGAVRAFDREVGRVLAKLDADGVTDRVVVIAGDHGEGLFEPGATTEHGKWFVGGEAANRTVLLLNGSGVPAGDIKGLRSGVDLATTLLDLAHVPPPANDGISLLKPGAEDRTIFAETTTWLGGTADRPPHTLFYPPITQLLEAEPDTNALVMRRKYSDVAVTAKLRAARRGSWELVYTPTPDGSELQLFDLAHDPYAQTDQAAEHPERVAELRDALFGWMAQDPRLWFDGRDRLVPRRER